MGKVTGRIVACFFLLMTAVDMTHPCLEKLEAAGLIADHFQDALGMAAPESDRPNSDSSRSGEATPVDDDCFCCRGDVLTEPFCVVAAPAMGEGTSLLPSEPGLLPALVVPLPRIHWPPGLDFPSPVVADSAPAQAFSQEEVLAGNLLSPPEPRCIPVRLPLAAIPSGLCA